METYILTKIDGDISLKRQMLTYFILYLYNLEMHVNYTRSLYVDTPAYYRKD